MRPAARRLVVALCLGLLALGGVALALLVGGDDGPSTADTGSRSTDACDIAPVQPASHPYLGVAVPDVADDGAAVREFGTAAGKPPALVLWFVDWSTEFPADAVDQVDDAGAVAILAWEPTSTVAGSSTTDLPEYRLSTIISGQHDTYIREFARAVREICVPVILRFAAEMNGDWHPWSEGVNGNESGEYVEAWRHVHDIFAAEGAGNVTWLWTPNIVGETSRAVAGYYPGDEYVDWVGLDGYNWGTTQPWTRWTPFAEVFDESLAQLAAVTELPVLISETASTEEGGDKAAWITDMWDQLRQRPVIRGIVWFEYDKETDWRIVSSPAAQAAFAEGATSPDVIGATG